MDFFLKKCYTSNGIFLYIKQGGKMLFNSYEFIFLFLPITLVVYFTLNRFEKNRLLVSFSITLFLFIFS
jgi:hypothetical protein